jgi:hypothetical protein
MTGERAGSCGIPHVDPDSANLPMLEVLCTDIQRRHGLYDIASAECG